MSPTAASAERVDAQSPVAAATIPEAFQRIVALRGDDPALRTIGGSVTMTWRDVGDRVRRLAAGLAGIGIGHGDSVALVLPNTIECHLIDYAAAHLGAVPFVVFNSEPATQIANLLRNSDAEVVFTNTVFSEKVREAAVSVGDQVRHIVVVDEGDQLARLENAADPAFDFDAAWQAVQPSDVACLIYTSGTTGPPKGAQWTHHSIMSTLRSLAAGVPIPDTSLISFLPLAHAGGRVPVHYMALTRGATITVCPDPADVPKALVDAHPDAFFSVPRFWEKLRVAIEGVIEAQPDDAVKVRIKETIEVGLEWAAATEQGSRVSPDDVARLAEKHQAGLPLLRPVLERLGLDRVVSAFVGGAPAPRELSMFFRAVGIPMLDAYGSTEASLCIFNQINNFKTGTIGRPLPGIEVRAADDGEMLIKGDSNFVGYRKQPDETAAAIGGDGWLRTGDIVEIDDDGFIRIIDRKKEIIINAAGKNMSPANIETAIKNESTLIGQVVAIGDGRRYVTAVITLDPEALANNAERLGVAGQPPAEVIESPALRAEIDAAVERGNKNLNRNEQIKKYVLLPDIWLPGGDVLTPTGKVKRRIVLQKYSDQIEQLYVE